ncbi:heme-binding domain-containing protein [Roseivirga sp.]|uniref:heme-binding domain-containing protein n=1 Tax=Roseivirga sp. TaxID=1964215 RepID=UPI002B26CB80|nr:heme-binding domain-containing protein [Roseivirga sp.]
MKKIIRYILLFILFAFVVIQFINRPEKISEPVTDSDIILALNVDQEIASMLKSACYDCHSNQPRYPWYANVAPINWWIGDHIEHGREELNFSLWSTFTARRRDHKLEEMVEMVETREMPLPNYLPMHKEAKLSDEQIEKLKKWANSERANIAAETETEN